MKVVIKSKVFVRMKPCLLTIFKMLKGQFRRIKFLLIKLFSAQVLRLLFKTLPGNKFRQMKVVIKSKVFVRMKPCLLTIFKMLKGQFRRIKFLLIKLFSAQVLRLLFKTLPIEVSLRAIQLFFVRALLIA